MSLYPISPLPAFDPAVDVEGFCQELLYRWLKRYFSATAFDYIDHNGESQTATWPLCDFGFEETAIPAEQLQRPLIHLYHPSGPTEVRCCGFKSTHRMICEVIVPANLARIAELPGSSAAHWVRHIADRAHYLMRTSEREALVPGGITRLEPLTRPSIQPAMPSLYRRSFPISFQFSA